MYAVGCVIWEYSNGVMIMSCGLIQLDDNDN